MLTTYLCRLLTLVALACCAPAPQSAPSGGSLWGGGVPAEAPADTLRVVFTGDVLLDRGVRKVVERRGVAHLFSGVRRTFGRAHAVVINMECPLTARVAPLSKRYIFRAEPCWADSLRAVGVTHAALANNHTNDQGRDGLADTYRHLRQASITPLGYGLTQKGRLCPAIVEGAGDSVAVFNAVTLPLENWPPVADGLPDVCRTSVDSLAEAILLFRRSHPAMPVVAVLHWGAEFQLTPHLMQRTAALRLARAGASAIVGHHPHVVQCADTLEGCPVFYSLGNFVFDQSAPHTCQGQMLLLSFSRGRLVGAEPIPVSISGCRPQEEWPQRKASP